MTSDAAPNNSPIRGRFFLPLLIAAGLFVLFFVALHSGDPSRLPSVLIGKPVPEFSLPPIEGTAETGGRGLSSMDLQSGEVSVVNVWASWCGPCIQEHPLLVDLKQEHGIRLMGINYKDQPDAAKRFLNRLGDPYDAIGADTTGRVAIDWGVYGVPETYIVDQQGKIVHKVVGPITEEIVKDELLPILSRTQKASTGASNDDRS